MSELGDARAAGKPLDDLLASAGAEALVPTDVQRVMNKLTGLTGMTQRAHTQLENGVKNSTRQLSNILISSLNSLGSQASSSSGARRRRLGERAAGEKAAGGFAGGGRGGRNSKNGRSGSAGGRERDVVFGRAGGSFSAPESRHFGRHGDLKALPEFRFSESEQGMYAGGPGGDPNSGMMYSGGAGGPGGPDANNKPPIVLTAGPGVAHLIPPGPTFILLAGSLSLTLSTDIPESELTVDSAFAQGVCTTAVNALVTGSSDPDAAMQLNCKVTSMRVRPPPVDHHDGDRWRDTLRQRADTLQADFRLPGPADLLAALERDQGRFPALRRRLATEVNVEYNIDVPGSLTDTVMQNTDPTQFDSNFQTNFASNVPGYTVSQMTSSNAPQQKEAPVAMVDFAAFFASIDFSQEAYCSNTNTSFCLQQIQNYMGFQVVMPDLDTAVAELSALIAAGTTAPTYMPFCDDYIITRVGASTPRLTSAAHCLSLVVLYFNPLISCYMQRGVSMVVDDPSKLTDWIIFRSDSANDRQPNPYAPPKFGCDADTATAAANSGLDVNAMELDWNDIYLRVEKREKASRIGSRGDPITAKPKPEARPGFFQPLIYNSADKWFVGSFRRGENLACKSGDAQIGAQCHKLCAQCGVQYSPVVSQVLDAVQECSDEASHQDWQGNGCAWYAENDPGCLVYANAETRSACRLTCNTCGKTNLMVQRFDITQDDQIEPNELNALLVATRKEMMRVSYHDLTRFIGWLCCYEKFPAAFVAQSKTCYGRGPAMREGPIGLATGMFDDTVAYKLLSNIELNEQNEPWATNANAKKKWSEWGFAESAKQYVPDFFYDGNYEGWKLQVYTQAIWKEECVDRYSSEQKMPLTLLTNSKSPLNMPLLDCL
eukprot:g18331.t1